VSPAHGCAAVVSAACMLCCTLPLSVLPVCCTLLTSLRKFCVVTRAGLSSIVQADLTLPRRCAHAHTRARTLHRHWKVVPRRFVCLCACGRWRSGGFPFVLLAGPCDHQGRRRRGHRRRQGLPRNRPARHHPPLLNVTLSARPCVQCTARLSHTAAGLPVEGLKPAFIALHRAIVLALPKELSACAQGCRCLSTQWGLQPIAAAGSSRAARQGSRGRLPCRAVPCRAVPLCRAVPCRAVQHAVAAWASLSGLACASTQLHSEQSAAPHSTAAQRSAARAA
jgi:hypothetical protein